MAAAGQTHAQNGVARLEQGGIDRQIGLGAAVGLYVDEFRAEQSLGAGNGQPLHLVDNLAAAVVALGGQALGVFVGQNGAHAGNDRRRGDVFRGDQLDVASLAAQLALEQSADLLVITADKFDVGSKFLKHDSSSL